MLASYSNETDLSSSLVAPSPANSHLKTSTDFPASGSMQRTCKASGKSSLTNQAFKPRKVMLKETNRLWILMQARYRMNADGSAAKRIIAASSAADGDATNRTPTKGHASNRKTSNCKKDADSHSTKRNKANGKTPERENAACEAAKREPAGRHIAQSEDGPSVSTHLPTFQIRTDGNRPQRQATNYP